jgi:hypothetical protein
MRMAALPAGMAVPIIHHLTFPAVLSKTRASGSGRVNARKIFRESDYA